MSLIKTVDEISSNPRNRKAWLALACVFLAGLAADVAVTTAGILKLNRRLDMLERIGEVERERGEYRTYIARWRSSSRSSISWWAFLWRGCWCARATASASTLTP